MTNILSSLDEDEQRQVLTKIMEASKFLNIEITFSDPRMDRLYKFALDEWPYMTKQFFNTFCKRWETVKNLSCGYKDTNLFGITYQLNLISKFEHPYDELKFADQDEKNRYFYETFLLEYDLEDVGIIGIDDYGFVGGWRESMIDLVNYSDEEFNQKMLKYDPLFSPMAMGRYL